MEIWNEKLIFFQYLIHDFKFNFVFNALFSSKWLWNTSSFYHENCSPKMALVKTIFVILISNINSYLFHQLIIVISSSYYLLCICYCFKEREKTFNFHRKLLIIHNKFWLRSFCLRKRKKYGEKKKPEKKFLEHQQYE